MGAPREGQADDATTWRIVLSVNGVEFFDVYVQNKGAPDIARVVEENTTEGGDVRPCFWSSGWPWSKSLRADLVVFYESVVMADDAPPPGAI